MKGHYSALPALLFGGLLVIGVISVLVVSMLRSPEISIPQEIELSRYPDLQIFLAARQDFRGIKHILDAGLYSFAFHTGHKNPEEFFAAIEATSKTAGWTTVSPNPLTKVYERPSGNYASARYKDQVTLSYEPKTSEVVFVLQPKYE